MKHVMRKILCWVCLLAVALTISACSQKSMPSGTTQKTAEQTARTTNHETASSAVHTAKPPRPQPQPEKPKIDRTSVVQIGASQFTQQAVCGTPTGIYRAFYKIAREDFIIPGLKQEFIPQGMDFWESKNLMLISGYFNGGAYPSSVIFAVDMESKYAVWYCKLQDGAGNNYKGHVGGVAVTERNLFLSAGKNRLFRYSLDKLEACKNGILKPDQSISVPSNASFCNYSAGTLWVGDFYLKGKYDTAGFAHLQTGGPEAHGAIVCGYRLEQTAQELKSSAVKSGGYAVPDLIFSVKDKIQGFSYDGKTDRVILSESYGRTNDSVLHFYRSPLKTELPHAKIKINGTEVPTWFLDSKTDSQAVLALPMLEGICVSDGSLYCLFESGANYYRLNGGKDPTDAVWKVSLSFLD